MLSEKIHDLQLAVQEADYQLNNYENLLQSETYALVRSKAVPAAIAV